MAVTDDRTRIVHLLRRAGFGASAAERERYYTLGVDGTLDTLLNYENIPDSVDGLLAGQTFDFTKTDQVQRWWFTRMVKSNHPLQEKMTLFWHGHLTSAIHKVDRADFMYGQNQLFRANALGIFDDILKKVTRDPAMLTWLDNRSNVRGNPNENYARELMELFTMGVGNYTETDVKESARALTGMGVQRDGTYVFRDRLFDSGVKTFLGKTGAFGADDIIGIICQRAETPRFLSRALFTFFVHDKPTDADLAPIIQAYWDSGHSVKAMMKAMLQGGGNPFSFDGGSGVFYSDAACRAHVTSPTEFVASTYRTLGIPMTVDNASNGVRLITAMGQRLLDPPDPSGWDEGPSWISTGNLLQRVNFAASLSRSNSYTPAELAPGLSDPTAIVDRLLALFVDGAVSANTRSMLVKEVSAAGNAAAGRIQRALNLVLALPEYQFA